MVKIDKENYKWKPLIGKFDDYEPTGPNYHNK